MKDVGRIASALALAFVCIIHLLAVVRLAPRDVLETDETEFLEGGVKVARGERLYVDFAEHHPPFIFDALASIVPSDTGNRRAIDRYVLRARIVSSLFGAIAIGTAAFLMWRATRTFYAPAILIGTLLTVTPLWNRAFSDVRSEPPALAFFWLGALLILAAGETAVRRVTFAGAGVGLIALACLINPKWPVASVAMGLFFVAAACAGWPLIVRGIVVGAVAVAAVLLLLVTTIDPGQYLDFVLLQSRAVFGWWLTHVPHDVSPVPFFYCPRILRPAYVFPAAAFVLIVAVTIRGAFRNVRIVYGIAALLAATFLEIRYVYPYPTLWVQYYILWGMAAAAVYAVLPCAIVGCARRLTPRIARFAYAVPVVVTFVAIIRSPDVLPPAGVPDPTPVANAALAADLRPGDTVWLLMWHHPLGARDASYYWFGFRDFVPGALAFAQTPRGARILPPIREEDLPPCRLERGLEPHLRLISGGEDVEPLPVVSACIDRLRARGVITATHIRNVFIVGPARR